MDEQELEQEQGQGGQSYPDIKRRLISADEARQLMVRSVRGLDSKLNEVSKIIQTTARRGETRAEVHSVQSSRSSLPIFDRIDNLGRVLLGSLRDSGYDAKLREFRTADSCMLYIVADWSRAIEKKPDDNLLKASEAAGGKRNQATPDSKPRASQPAARARSASPPPSEAAKKADDSADIESDLGPSSTTDAPAPDDLKATDAKPEANENSTGDSSSDTSSSSAAANAQDPSDEPEGQSTDSESRPDKKEVKTKKFDRNKLLGRNAAKKSARQRNKSLLAADKESESYTYSTEANGERIPIIYPVVMPSRAALLQ